MQNRISKSIVKGMALLIYSRLNFVKRESAASTFEVLFLRSFLRNIRRKRTSIPAKLHRSAFP